jgi:uroporphyrinogen-III synthase
LNVRLLVTRSQPNAARTAMALQARGHQAIVTPLFEIEILSKLDPNCGPWDAVLLTSANALGAMAGLASHSAWRDLPIFAVGERTAQAAREHHFTAVISANGNVDDLADLVTARLKPSARLLYLAGEARSGDLAGALRAKGFDVATVAVYRAVVAQTLPDAAAAALAAGIDGVLHFSRRSAEGFLAAARKSGLLEAALKKPVHYCLSAQVAEPLRGAGAADVRIAVHPDEASLVALCG